MSALEFLSPDAAAPEAVWRSPLERALRGAPPEVEDVSRTGKIEVRGELGGGDLPYEAVRISPERALVLCPYEEAARVRAELRDQFLAIDLTAALAGLRVRGERLMRRLTDLDLAALPAVGPVARVRTVVLRDGEETFRLFFPQEYGDYLAGAVLDALEGLR